MMQIEYGIFWIVLSIGFIILAVFPSIAYWLTVKLGIMSVNLVFVNYRRVAFKGIYDDN